MFSSVQRSPIYSLTLFAFIVPVLSEFEQNKDYGYEKVQESLVTTSDGVIIGTNYRTLKGRKVFAYYGVPYASPPIDNLRFEPPQPVKPWKGILEAVHTTICSQYNHYAAAYTKSDGIIGQEDCLYLNIHTPRIYNSTLSLMPVIVYIHGGAFMFGVSTPYKPRLLLKKDDTVFVTINYRLGPLGFLTTEDKVVPGNMGLKDQQLALKWIRNNIQAFGGDREKVTLVGTSAGGASVHYHYLSRESRGLFWQGMSMSGTALCPWALMEHGKEKAQMLGSAFSCPLTDTQSLVSCLKTVSVYKMLLQIKPLFMLWLYYPFSPFGPTIEREGDNPFLDTHPYQMLLNNDVKDASWIVSIASEESLYPCAQCVASEPLLWHLNDHWNWIFPHIFDFNYTAENKYHEYINKAIYDYYFPKSNISMHYRKYVIDMMSDRLFVVDIGNSVKLQTLATKSPIYVYKFSYTGGQGVSRGIQKTLPYYGVSRIDDAVFALGCYYIATNPLSADYQLAEILNDMWNIFAHRGVSRLKNAYGWLPVGKKNDSLLKYLNFRYPFEYKIITNDNVGNKIFWESLPIMENKKFREDFFYSP